MKILNREITVANRFIYYYANFVERIYGFVLRKDGENIPHEHYVGRLKKTHRSHKARTPKRSTLRTDLHRSEAHLAVQ